MNVLLDAIKFNHDPTSATFDALNIRKNDKQFITIPEWRRGISVNPEDSPAAYALFETRGNAITIRAKFKHTSSTTQRVEVRALNQYVDSRSSNYVTQLAAQIINPALRVFIGGPLGNVQSRQVTFTATGETDYEIFALQNPRLWELGVGVHDITWLWQYRLDPGSPWIDFDTSRHRIYAVLRQPQSPWKQTPFESSNLQLPWTAVLERACRWAATSQNPTEAATYITRSVYNLGEARIARYCQAAHYIVPNFNVFKCAKFLFDLRLGSMRLNCTDCGTIVSTFANILGGDLWQSETKGFDYNPVLRIGESEWHEGHFELHVVAWEDECDIHNDVFDACLQVDGDENPTNTDCRHVQLLPTDIRFGRLEDNLYRYRLVAPNNPPSGGDPRPDKRVRRIIQTFVPPDTFAIDLELIEKAKLTFDFDSWSREDKTGSSLFLQGVTLIEEAFDGWTLLRKERFRMAEGAVLYESLWRALGVEEDSLLLVNIYEGTSVQDARGWLLNFLASLHSFDDLRKEKRSFTDVYFILADKCGVVFPIANIVIMLESAGKYQFELDVVAENLLRKVDVVKNLNNTVEPHKISRFKLAKMEYKVDMDIPLLVEDPDPFDGLSLAYKFITNSGLIRFHCGKLNYCPLEAGPQEVRVFAANRNGGLFEQKLELCVVEEVSRGEARSPASSDAGERQK